MSSRKKNPPTVPVAESTPESAVAVVAAHAPSADVASPFIGQWNRLVSSTNWEKGRIITQWREALQLAGADVIAYSDEAWAQLVGGVTSQHVGRLRRVFQRFGAVFDQYEGLYWSHFQTTLDWADAEMWLEGAIHNGWSVSQMRGKRWETLGNIGDPPQDPELAPDDEVSSSEDAFLPDDAPFPDGEAASAAGRPAKADRSQRDSANPSDAESSDESDVALDSIDSPSTSGAPAKSRNRLAVDVDDLPADVADAFEQFKLAIIAHRRAGWRETTPPVVIECLDALRELALAPADD